MLSRLRAACRTNETQVATVVIMSAMHGIAVVGADSWVFAIGAVLFWPVMAFVTNLINPMP